MASRAAACKKCGYKFIFNEQAKLHQVTLLAGKLSFEVGQLGQRQGRGKGVCGPSPGRLWGGMARVGVPETGRPGTGRTRARSGSDGVLGSGPET